MPVALWMSRSTPPHWRKPGAVEREHGRSVSLHGLCEDESAWVADVVVSADATW